MKCFSNCLFVGSFLLFIVFSLFNFSPCLAMHSSVQPTTLDRVNTILSEQFDTHLTEPWYRPVTGFALGRRLSKSSVVEALGYGAALTCAGTTGVTLGALIYAIKTMQFGAIAGFLGSAGSCLASGLVSWPVLMATCPATSSVVFIEIMREIYRRTARGKCLTLRMQLAEELKSLRILYLNCRFDFESVQDAERCAKSLYANSTWPLVDLVERLNKSIDLVRDICKGVDEIEKGGISDSEVRSSCTVLKVAGKRLTEGLFSNIRYIKEVPSFVEQERKYVEYLKQLSDREVIVRAGGDLSYRVGATYGTGQPLVVAAAR
jgi:hypothetical protein